MRNEAVPVKREHVIYEPTPLEEAIRSQEFSARKFPPGETLLGCPLDFSDVYQRKVKLPDGSRAVVAVFTGGQMRTRKVSAVVFFQKGASEVSVAGWTKGFRFPVPRGDYAPIANLLRGGLNQKPLFGVWEIEPKDLAFDVYLGNGDGKNLFPRRFYHDNGWCTLSPFALPLDTQPILVDCSRKEEGEKVNAYEIPEGIFVAYEDTKFYRFMTPLEYEALSRFRNQKATIRAGELLFFPPNCDNLNFPYWLSKDECEFVEELPKRGNLTVLTIGEVEVRVRGTIEKHGIKKGKLTVGVGEGKKVVFDIYWVFGCKGSEVRHVDTVYNNKPLTWTFEKPEQHYYALVLPGISRPRFGTEEAEESDSRLYFRRPRH